MLYLPREDGQGSIEYFLVVALIAIAVMVVLGFLNDIVGNLFKGIEGGLESGLESR